MNFSRYVIEKFYEGVGIRCGVYQEDSIDTSILMVDITNIQHTEINDVYNVSGFLSYRMGAHDDDWDTMNRLIKINVKDIMVDNNVELSFLDSGFYEATQDFWMRVEDVDRDRENYIKGFDFKKG